MWACDVCLYIYTSGDAPAPKNRSLRSRFFGEPRRRAADTGTRRNNRTERKTQKITGLPKSIAELFGKRRRNGATGADCESKPPGKRSLRRRGRGGARHRAEPLANRPAHTAARFPIFFPRFSLLSASSLSFLCSPVPCIRPRPSSRKSPRG